MGAPCSTSDHDSPRWLVLELRSDGSWAVIINLVGSMTCGVIALLCRICSQGALPLKISARNRPKGKIVEVNKGATTAYVRIDIGNGLVVTSSITNESVDELGLAVGGEAYAIVKASEVAVD